MSTQIAVTGRAEIRTAPELGVVRLSVVASGPHRDDVLQRAGGAHQELLAELRAFEGSEVLENWSADQLRVWSHRPWNAEGRQLPLVHEARGDLELVFRDAGALGEWLSAVALRDQVTITGVEWRLTDATERRVREEAQRGAVGDAVAKASAYAAALGLGEPVPVELADHGLLSTRPVPPGPQPVMMRAAAFDASGGPVTELSPADLVTEASVEARFLAEPA